MRAPDLIIGNPPQTLRWHLFKWRGWQFALHKWLKSDDDRALHDHSGDNVSFILSPQGYVEQFFHPASDPSRMPKGLERAAYPFGYMLKFRRAWWPYFRKGETPHRVQLHDERPVWTLWLRWPPRREWGFWCSKGWRHWRDYINGDYRAPGSQSTIGRGCDE